MPTEFSPRPRPRGPSFPAPAATIDPLESRVLLAASLTADGTLEVAGTDGPDQVTIRRGTEPNHLHVQEGSTTLFVFLLDRVKAVSVDLGAGDDALIVDTTRGLVTGAAGDLSLRVSGGAGNDSIHVTGAPAGGGVGGVLAVGPGAGAGTLVSRVGTGWGQALGFAGMESLVDTSAAASLAVVGNDGANVIELSAGPLAGGATPTGMVRFFDVTPCPVGTPVVATHAPAGAAAIPSGVVTSSASSPTAAADARDPESRREAKRLAKAARREAQRLAKEAKRVAREQKRANAKKAGGVAPAAAAAVPAPASELFVIERSHLSVHFANKAAVTIDAAGGDDRVDLNLAGATPAGMQSLTLDCGAGNDRVAERAVPAGVVVLRRNAEATSPTRDFVPTTECPPVYVPPIPDGPPPPVPGGGSSAATSSRDRDDTSSRNASASRNASSSRDADASGSADRDSGGSNDRDTNASNDRNASNGD